MSSVPGGTLTGMPSIVRLTTSLAISALPSRDQHGLPLARDVVLEFTAELLDAGDDGRRAGVGEHADRLPRHVLREVEQEIEVCRLPLPRKDPLEDLGGPRGAFAALGALGARLVRVEAREPHDLVDHVGGIIAHNHAPRAEHGGRLYRRLAVQQAGVAY